MALMGLVATVQAGTFEVAEILTVPDEAQGFGMGGMSRSGDLDGDGNDDLLVGADHGSDGGAVYIFHGSPLGLEPPMETVGPDGASSFGLGPALGDLNGDGVLDVAVGCRAPEDLGCLYVGDGSQLPSPDWIFLEGYGERRHLSHDDMVMLDLDGDGRDELVGSVFGGALVFDDVLEGGDVAELLVVEDSTNRTSLAGGGDLNGDGFPDIVLGFGEVWVFFGGEGLEDVRTYVDEDVKYFGLVGDIGDVDGDGFDDLAICAVEPEGEGLVFVYPGSPAGLDQSAARSLDHPQWPSPEDLNWCGDVDGFGDVDGDGQDDFWIRWGGLHLLYFGDEANSPFEVLGDTVEVWAQPIGDVNGDGHADMGQWVPGSSPEWNATITVYYGACRDRDGDGHCVDIDCDDDEDAVNPGASEVQNGVDDDCDGLVDESESTEDTGAPLRPDEPRCSCGHGSPLAGITGVLGLLALVVRRRR